MVSIGHYYFVQQEHNDRCKRPYIEENQISYDKTKIKKKKKVHLYKKIYYATHVGKI